MKRILTVLAVALFIISGTSLVFAKGGGGHGAGGHGGGVHGQGLQNLPPKASEDLGEKKELQKSEIKEERVGSMPPGLEKQDKVPPGLEKKDKTPKGWKKGEKEGWEK